MAFGLLSGLLGGKDGALKQVASVIDSIHTSEEEKLDKKIIMQRIQQKLAEKQLDVNAKEATHRSVFVACLLYTSPSPRDGLLSRMPSSA